MYIHLGGDTVVSSRSIVGIFDMESTSVSRSTRDYLSSMEDDGRVFDVSGEIPKSYVVCLGPSGDRIYLSQISAATLKKRAAQGIEDDRPARSEAKDEEDLR